MFGFYKTDDPVADYEQYDHLLHAHDDLYPVCEECEEHILPGEWYFKIGKKHYHEKCLEIREMEELYD